MALSRLWSCLHALNCQIQLENKCVMLEFKKGRVKVNISKYIGFVIMIS